MSVTDFDIKLLPWQEEVWRDPARFQVIAAGRRTGKTEYSAYRLLVAALQATDKQSKTFYVAPTQQQARDVMWDKLMELGHSVIKSHHINNMTITLLNDQTIFLKGADRPDTMRGVKTNLVVLDEYGIMKPETWDVVLEPTTADLQAPVVFVGTPDGRNWFYDLYTEAKLGDDPDWSAHHFTSYDNPYINREEIDRAKRTKSSYSFKQEYLASFEARGSEAFKEEWISYQDSEPKGGEFLIAGDLAGFEEAGKKKNSSRRDNTCFALVKVGDFEDSKGKYNWWIKDMVVGRWTTDETARKFFSMVTFNHPTGVGIERGIAKQAVMSPISDLQRKHNKYFNIQELTHGNKKKSDRIIWALQGRFENGNIRLNKGEWNDQFLDELFQFPSPLTHDDMPDALAYIDQLAQLTYTSDFEFDDFAPLDELTGY